MLIFDSKTAISPLESPTAAAMAMATTREVLRKNEL
jgi:hypothetical protein